MSSLSLEGLQALTWTLTAGAVALTAGRYYIRARVIKQFLPDDLTHGLALLALLAFNIVYTINFPLNYKVEFFKAGISSDEPTLSEYRFYLHLIIAASATFWVISFLVKLSFLFLYRAVFKVSYNFMLGWWATLAFTVVTSLANFISVFFSCGTPSKLYDLSVCFQPFALETTRKFVIMWCTLNVLSDVTIIVLPISALRPLQMSNGQKVALSALFSVAIVDVIFDILRTINTVNGGTIALDTIWDILEPTIAVILSTLPAYSAVWRSVRKE